ncbi:MAG TPA: hypothetical protein VGN63_19050 [Flavisolibacter sp.]|jgi:hypothetical protein|nr:hypothetical protein [Flavisolibacter sp.]
MGITQTVEKWNNKIGPYQTLIGMLIFFIGGAFGIYEFIIRPSDLSVSIDKKEINYPSTANNKFNNVYRYLVDSVRNKGIQQDAAVVYEYLINTQDFWTVILKNESDKTVKSIKLRITNVTSVNNFGISSPYLLDNESNEILSKIAFHDKSGIIYLDNIAELPSQASVSLYIWGKMPKLQLDENVFITYDGGEAKPAIETTVTGFQSYLATYIYEILLITLLIFIAVYIHAVNRKTNATP